MIAPLNSIGPFHVEATAAGISLVRFGATSGVEARARPDVNSTASRLVAEAHRQLQEYLDGNRSEFDLPFDLSGATPFRKRVLDALLEIPYGQTRSYGEVARQVGCRSARAVGGAVGWNPLPVLIPCHRVVAGDGGLGGFSGGLERKRALLTLEGSGSLEGLQARVKDLPESGGPVSPGAGRRLAGSARL